MSFMLFSFVGGVRRLEGERSLRSLSALASLAVRGKRSLRSLMSGLRTPGS